MRELGKEIFEMFQVPPKRFIQVLFELYDILPNEGGLID